LLPHYAYILNIFRITDEILQLHGSDAALFKVIRGLIHKNKCQYLESRERQRCCNEWLMDGKLYVVYWTTWSL